MKAISYMVIFFAALALVAFFMPWIKGAGSLAKPLDDATRKPQEIDSSGLAEGTVRAAKGVADKLVQTITPIKLKQSMAGYQIPFSKNQAIRKLGKQVYLIYLVPLAAIICMGLSLSKRSAKLSNRLVPLISAVIFIALHQQMMALYQEGLFIRIKPCLGLLFSVYCFLVIAVLSFARLLLQIMPDKGR